MKLSLATLAALFLVFHSSLCSENSSEFAIYDAGPASIKFSYPAAYVLQRNDEKEAKWVARINAVNNELSIEALSHGYCSERLKEEEGYKSPEEYVLSKICGENIERAKFDGYDCLVSRAPSSVTVVFLRHEAEWGRCYQQLTFTFAKDAYAKVRGTITQVIESAQPSFDAKRWE